jgi:hypothetical protein
MASLGGDYTSGVMAGDHMLSFVPLHQSAIERSPSLLHWLQEWIPQPNIVPLTPSDWFTRGHGTEGGTKSAGGAWWPTCGSETLFLWTPAPGAAACALHQLALSRQKRPHLNHVFICPRLMTADWRKKLFKLADLVLELPPGCVPWWPSSMFEPLLLGLTLCFIVCNPWQLRNSPGVLDMGREVRRMWCSSEAYVGRLLRQLCELPDVLDALPEGVVREMLYPAPPGQVL